MSCFLLEELLGWINGGNLLFLCLCDSSYCLFVGLFCFGCIILLTLSLSLFVFFELVLLYKNTGQRIMSITINGFIPLVSSSYPLPSIDRTSLFFAIAVLRFLCHVIFPCNLRRFSVTTRER